MKSLFALGLSAVALVVAGCGGDGTINCGPMMHYERSLNRCVCPEGTVFMPTAERACVPIDGGLDASDNPDSCIEQAFYRDTDRDSHGDPTVVVSACNAPDGFVAIGDDCDDACNTCHPAGTEVCDGVLDEDCVGGVDDGCACIAGMNRACGSDEGECIAGTQECALDTWEDCTGKRGPSAETCNGLDDNCDMAVDGPDAAIACGLPTNVTTVECSTRCIIGDCSAGRADCDDMFETGCEEILGTELRCGTCTDSCGWHCDAGSCNDATMVGGGNSFTCAARERDIVCWGGGTAGELGNGASTSSLRLVRVSDLTSVTQLSVGSRHTCAIAPGGIVSCWGANNAGQLGNGSTGAGPTPIPVSGGLAALAIGAGYSHTCAAWTGGFLDCWGDNFYGQLGNGTTISSSVPFRTSLGGASAIAGGFAHTCVLKSGNIWCWGLNASGQLGYGGTIDQLEPVRVDDIAGATGIAAGFNHSCALMSDRTVRCWGNNGYGQLGNDRMTGNSSAPVEVMGISNVTAIAAGGAHSCAVLADGSVRCWGRNDAGQIGDGSMTDRPIPADPGVSGAATLGLGTSHSCAVLTDGSVQCWGQNTGGQLGDDSRTPRPTPGPVLPPMDP